MEYHLLDRVYSFIDILIRSGKRSVKNIRTKRCPVTELDISMQPKNSKFLSFSGIEWYYNNEYEVFKKILEPKLSETWKDKPLNIQFREIAHAIRNSDSNPRNNTKKTINRILYDQNTLFNNINLIDKKKLRKAGLI